MQTESSDDLFLLFETLSKAEKRYISVRMDTRPEGYQLCWKDLLNLHDKPEDFEKITEKNFPDPKLRSKIKRGVYKQILSSLGDYEMKTHPDLKLYKLLQDARVLHQRGLYNPSQKIIRQGKKLAEQLDRKWAIAHFIEMEATMEGLLGKEGKKKGSGEQAFQNAYEGAREYMNYRKLLYYDALLINLFNQEGAVGTHEKDFFLPIREKADYAVNQTGFFTPYLGRHILATLALLSGDNEEMYEQWVEIEQLFDENPKASLGLEVNYFRMLHFRGLMALSVQKFEEARQILAKLEAARPKQSRLIPIWSQMYYVTLGQVAQNLGDRELLRQYVDGFERDYAKVREKLETVYASLMRFLRIVAMFMLDEHKQALSAVLDLLAAEPSQQARKFNQILGTMQLCLYCQLGQWETLEEQWPKMQRFLEKQIVFPKFWLVCTRFFEQMAHPQPAKARKRITEEFLNEASELFGAQEDANVLSHFNFLVWAQGFLHEKGMPEVLAAQASAE